MKDNQIILKEREAAYNKRTGPRVGDFLLLPHGEYTRFTHDWGSQIQTGGGSSGFYLGNGYISYSGGLDSGISLHDISHSGKKKEGSIWFFDEGLMGGGRGKSFTITFRVYELMKGADLKGLPQIKAHAKKLLLEKVEKITRINGNGQEYILPLPEVRIKADEINDHWIKCFNKETGLVLNKDHWGYSTQPMTHVQFNLILVYCSWKTTFYNNASHSNLLVLEFNRNVIKAM